MSDTIRLLLVEDDTVLQMDLGDALQAAGYEPLVATNGEQAIVALDAAANDLRAVVTSIKIGDGADGWEVARHARRLKPSVPVVYISGASPVDWSVYGVPNSVLVEKPFAPTQVVVAVSTLLLRASGG